MATLFQDLRFGFRLLGRQRGFTAVAALVLALGIGANTAVFSLVNALVLKPRPGAPDAELAGVYSRDRTQADKYRGFSYPNYADLRARTDLFRSLAAHTFSLVGLGEGEATRRVFIDIATANFFDTFGVPLLHGRTFSADEERPGADIPVTILSYGAWQRMGGRPDLVGSQIRLNGRQFTVIGVAPRGFGGSMVLVSPELWVPTGVYDTISNDFIRAGLPATMADRRHHTLILIARLPSGATIASVAPGLEAAGVALERAFPGENKDQALTMAPLARMSVSTRPQTDSELGALAALLFSMSGLVLLVASLNLANMLLARGSSRRKEFAIRLALGGSRLRVVRQLLTEGLALSLVGGVVATFVAWWATRLIGTSLASRLPITIQLDPTPDARVLIVTVLFCLVSAVLFGLGPAWRQARTDAVPELKEQAGELRGRRPAGLLGRFRLPTRDLLVMGQLALSLVTLTAAGLFVRAALQSASADPGFSLDRGIVANVDPSLGGRNTTQTQRYYEQALARLRATAGVQSASVTSLVAFGEFTETEEVQRAGTPLRHDSSGSKSMSFGSDAAGDEKIPGLVESVAPSVGADYFKTIGLPVTRGREFLPNEEISASGMRVAIIDETLAGKLFGAENPVGQLVQFSKRQSPDPVVLQVVGVVAPSRHQLLEHEMRPHLYLPYGQEFRAAMYLHIRTAASSAEADAAMLPAIRRELRDLDPAVPIMSLETLPMFRERNFDLWTLRTGANIFLAFGAIALFMAAIGIYGVKAYVVARRTREIGIRLALGATPRNVVGMVLKDGAVLAIAGITLGLLLSVVAGGAIRGLLFGDTRFDAPVVLAAALVLGGSALLASWLPARRATRIAATIAMRS
jgi:putative ABC transport system permease protein